MRAISSNFMLAKVIHYMQGSTNSYWKLSDTHPPPNSCINLYSLSLFSLSLTSIVKELFSRNVDTVKSKDGKGNTPLHLACTKGSYEVAEFIIECQVADIEAR